MVAKNRMVGLTEPVIGHHGGDLDHSNVRYRTIEAIERLFLPVFTFPSHQIDTWACSARGTGDHATPGDLRACRTVCTGCQAADLQPLTRRSRLGAEQDLDGALMSPMERIPRPQGRAPQAS
jgi:hypothetical protein